MYRLTTSLPYMLNRVGVRMGELFSKRLTPYGITLQMYRVLAALSERRDQRLSDLGEMTSIEISTLSRLVGTMKQMGLISRDRLPSDERTVRINLTPKGTELAEELMPQAAHYEDVITQSLSADEVSTLKDNLRAIQGRLAELEAENAALLEAAAKANARNSA
ncbi:MAG: MarR family transcriptional regulator [Aquisalimonadaceae bacterium]